MKRYDEIQEVTIAKTFEEILKFNPYHDARGRFASANSYASFTTRTRDPNKQHMADMAIARAKQNAKQQTDSKGFKSYDDADYHGLYNGKGYYQQQQLTAAQKAACTQYLQSDTEPGSLYSMSQNMNYAMATDQKLTAKQQQVHDELMGAMHNLGYNLTLDRYDHDGYINGMLQKAGINKNYNKLTEAELQNALVGKTLGENKFISTSYNDFKNAPQSSKDVFMTRCVKVTYKAKASTQAMMPGNGPGGSLGEIILAPTKNNPGTIVDVKYTGQKARQKGAPSWDLSMPQVEIIVELG